MTIDEIYLSEAVKEARAGTRSREEPVGAVAGASGGATTRLGAEGGRMRGAALYVTEMPCRMCVAAAQHAGIRRIAYGVRRRVAPARRIPMAGGVLKRECASLRGSRLSGRRRAVC